MDKNLEISLLYDFYKELLTEKQADMIELYYNQDLSLSEISEHFNITRQGVRDSIKRGEKQLLELEQKLGLVQRFILIQNKISTVQNLIYEVEALNSNKICSKELQDRINAIKIIIQDVEQKV